jgi:hypothetical protein
MVLLIDAHESLPATSKTHPDHMGVESSAVEYLLSCLVTLRLRRLCRYQDFWVTQNHFMAQLYRSPLITVAAIRGACPAGEVSWSRGSIRAHTVQTFVSSHASSLKCLHRN